MTDSLLERTIALRDEAFTAALQEALASPIFESFKALDEAVSSMGGARFPVPTTRAQNILRGPGTVRSLRNLKVRPSQGFYAYKVLSEVGRPLALRELMEAVKKKGVAPTGADPLSNFRSTLSRDERFRSVVRKGQYYWWLSGSPLPVGWKEAEPDDFDSLLDSASDDHTSQEGGDGHGPPTT